MVGVARPNACTTTLPSLRTRAIRLALSTAALLAAASPAAHSAGVELRTAVATGIQKADRIAIYGQYSAPAGINPYCTPEPKAIFWGAQNFVPTNPINTYGARTPGEANYTPPNLLSAADLRPSLQAGSRTDFCVGFSLTPNVDPAIVRTPSKPNGFRIQGTPAQTDDPATRVADASNLPVDGDDMQRIVLDLPAGYLGSPAAIPECNADTDFGAADHKPVTCPAASQLGDAYVRVNNFIRNAIRVHVPLTGSPIYNLTHGPNEVGRLGVVVQPFPGIAPVKFTIRLTFVPDGSGRIRTIVDDAPQYSYDNTDTGQAGQVWRETGETLTAGDPRIGQLQFDADPYPLYIESVGIRTWGSKADHPTMPADFGELGTNCSADAAADVTVTTYGGQTSTMQADPIRFTDCATLDFRPSVEVTSSVREPGQPTGVQVAVNLGQNATGRTTALLKDATIRLPRGLELGAQVASIDGGLRLCRASEFAYASQSTPALCKEGSAVGNVTIDSPLIREPYTGTVYLGEQRAVGELPDLYVEASPAGATADDAPRVKLIGQVRADQQTGQITAEFLNNPQLRFSRILFDFPAGPNSFFTTPPRCGEYTGDSTLTPWSGGPASTSPSSITVDQACDLPGAPTVDISSANATSGARSQTRITIERPDRGAWLTHLNIDMPSGLFPDLNIPTECPAAQAKVGACPQSSRLGTVTALAGAGSQPWNLAGALYLTDRLDGDVAGTVIVVRAAVGDLDLGDVIVPGRIKLRPTNAGLTFDADIPTRFRGVALQLRKVLVDLDRANLMVNPTSCGPVAYRATVDTDAGPVNQSSSMSFAGCEQLPFRPTLKAQITGDNRPGGHPGMYVRLDSPEGDAGMRSAAVTLPDGVAVDLDNVKSPCTKAQFDAVQCPASTRVGSVTARVSITNEVINGDIYLLRVEGKRLPGLGLSFYGRYTQRVTSTVDLDSKQRIVTTFPDIPDLPLRQLVVQVDSTPRSPLTLPPTACANGSRWNGTFIGYGGQKAIAETGLQCAAAAEVRLGDRRGLSLRLFDFGGRRLAAIKVTVPKGWAIRRGLAARRADQMWVRMTGGTAKIRLSASSLTAFATTKTVSTVRLKLGGDVVAAVSPRARRAKRATVRVRLVFTDGTVQVQQRTVRSAR